MSQQLSLSARPRKFGDVIAQQHVTEELENYYATNDDLPVVLLFAGPSGVGKTSLARLCAISLECTHSGQFGYPCKDCYRAFSRPDKYQMPEDAAYDLTEIDCGDLTGIDKIRAAVSGSNFAPNHGAKYRQYILDEFDAASKSAQKFLKKTLEDSPSSTKFYLCTTQADMILPDIIGRAVVHTFRRMDGPATTMLVTKLLTKSKSDLDPDLLADLLIEHRVGSARAITQAVTKYLSGATPETAAQLDGLGDVDYTRVVRNVVKGDWDRLASLLQPIDAPQARECRKQMTLYLKGIMLEDKSREKRIKASKGIVRLTQMVPPDDSLVIPAVVSGLHDVCLMWSKISEDEND